MFSVKVRDLDTPRPVIVICGEVDIATAPDLAEIVAMVIANAPRDLVLDLAGTTFLGCAGLSVIVSARRHLPEPSRVVLRGPRPFVRKVLTLTEMDSVCIIEDEVVSPVLITDACPQCGGSEISMWFKRTRCDHSSEPAWNGRCWDCRHHWAENPLTTGWTTGRTPSIHRELTLSP